MMTFLITGEKGYLGSIISKYLQSKGHKVISLGRHMNNDVICDLSHSIPLIPEGIDYVIHAAGKAHSIPKTKKDKLDFLNVNVNGTENLLTGLKKHKITGFLFISSVAVYGRHNGEDISENYPLLADDPYGQSKIKAEGLIQQWGKKQSVKISILRPPLIIGKDAPGNLGSMINAIRKKRYANIAGGKAKRSVVLAEDIALFTEEFLKCEGTYNITDNYDPSFYEISKVITDHYKLKHVKNIPMPLARILGYLGTFIQFTLKIEFPFSSNKLKKMTSNLTFSCDKAINIGWRPRKATNHPKVWLENIK